jgi:hypothetical protein
MDGFPPSSRLDVPRSCGVKLEYRIERSTRQGLSLLHRVCRAVRDSVRLSQANVKVNTALRDSAIKRSPIFCANAPRGSLWLDCLFSESCGHDTRAILFTFSFLETARHVNN